MHPIEKLSEILQAHPNSPFLFVGSGFSLRYTGMPTFKELLKKFTPEVNNFEYYYSGADSNLERCASLMVKDFREQWFKSDKFKNQKAAYESDANFQDSPLKIAISESLKTDYQFLQDANLKTELEILAKVNIAGVITTNWDTLLEQIFPKYDVFIGQQSIVCKTPQNIGEIFKIHGCCTKPNSLVLTEEDFNKFAKLQAYLAAKLITIFCEHPIVFIGYSIEDKNITALLRSILHGLGTDEIKHLQKNLIFVQRVNSKRPEGVGQIILVSDNTPLPVTDDFSGVYETLAKHEQKLPVRILRFCKQQLYEIAILKEPSKRLEVRDVEEIEKGNDAGFIVGFSKKLTESPEHELSEEGIIGWDKRDIYEYIVFNKKTVNGRKIVEKCIPKLARKGMFLPVFRFLNEAGISDLSTLPNTVQWLANRDRKGFTSVMSKKTIAAIQSKSMVELIASEPPPQGRS